MRDFNSKTIRSRLGRFLLDLDARLDSALFQSVRIARDGYERFSLFMDRFHVAGFRRVAVEFCSESATLGTGGLVLMLMLALPAFRETADDDWLKRSELSVRFLDRYGNEIGSRGVRQNESIPLEALPDHLIKAVLATEDRRFYEHFGIDVTGTLRALSANARAGGVVQGGSSLTQQLAKNLFLSNDRTFERKIKEAFLALWLETRLTKNQILKLYLDRAYMGGGTFGVEAASHYYFGKSARDVSLSEAAMLAGLFKAPSKLAPHANLPAARGRASVVLDNLIAAGLMTEGQVFGARQNPAKVVDRHDQRIPNYYLDWAFEEIKRIAMTLPPSVTDRAFVVRTGLDSNIQRVAEIAVESVLRQYGNDYNASQAALVLMDVDGAVRAMVGGREYGASQFNRATDALRQPGSSFKPYVFASAFEHGFSPASIVRDERICLGNWCPQNYNRAFAGAVTLTTAMVRSINTIPVRLSVQIGGGNAKAGRAEIIELAQKMGLRHPIPDSSALPIGAAEVTVLEHTSGFTAFANDGKASSPYAVLELRSSLGEVLWRADRDREKPPQVISPQVAMDMNAVLNQAVEDGTGRRAIPENGVKVAGKTGTTNAYRDAWFVGYSGNYVCGVWFGNDDFSPTNRMTGGSLPAMTFRQVMAYAHQGMELRSLPGVAPEPASTKARVATSSDDTAAESPAVRPASLTRRAVEMLNRMEQRMDELRRLETAPSAAAPSPTTVADRRASDGSDNAGMSVRSR